MNDLHKKTPFKVPKKYFELFEKMFLRKIGLIRNNDGFITPVNYFNTVETEILSKVNYSSFDNSLRNYVFSFSAIVATIAIFIFFEENKLKKLELEEFFLDQYLSKSSTYEIADHFDSNTLSYDLVIDSYNSISIEDIFEIKIFSENPYNLNIHENE